MGKFLEQRLTLLRAPSQLEVPLNVGAELSILLRLRDTKYLSALETHEYLKCVKGRFLDTFKAIGL